MKQDVVGLRRATGDWFVLEVDGQRRVLVFRSLVGAWRARAKNDQLMLYWPALVDERALAQFATADDGQPVGFWLVDDEDPATDIHHGHPLEYMQLCTLERLAELPVRAKSRWLADQWSQLREWAFR